MAFEKTIPSIVAEYELYDASSSQELEKAASVHVDIPDGFVFDPDYLYMWVRIVSAGEYYGPNKNGDYFPESELLAHYQTFKNAHTFKNHENKKVENAIGEIISVRWNPVMKCVEVFKSLDRKRAPEIVRGFIKGYLTDVSMGCRVPYTMCSVCGNKARRKSEFCTHVEKYRMQFLGNGERVFEINYQPKFHDSSTVLTGAERVAKAFLIIDKPPQGAAVSFKKVASERAGVSHYVKLSDAEMEKVAHYRGQIHPLLKEPVLEKAASLDGHVSFMDKMAELEKMLTGKLVNISSSPNEGQVDKVAGMLRIIKFLTEKRLDDETLSSIARTVNNLANSEGIPPQRAFSVLLGIAELLGIEFFPQELHTLLREITDAKLNDELRPSEDDDVNELYPSEFTKGMRVVGDATESIPPFNDPSSLFHLYDEGAHNADLFRQDPMSFLSAMPNDGDNDSTPPVKVIRIIRQTLTPIMPTRSGLPEFLFPRLLPILSGDHPIIGNNDARKDFEMMVHPQTLGDMLGTFAYRNYQNMRPGLIKTRIIKLAMDRDSELEKVAFIARNPDYQPKFKPPTPGLLRPKNMLMYGLPGIFALSAFEKTKRKNGQEMSNFDNFAADHPGILTGGMFLARKPLSHLLYHGKNLGGKAYDFASNKVGDYFDKTSSAAEYEEIVKLADTIPSGQFNAFGEEFMRKFAEASGFKAKEVIALKIATLLSVQGLDKEAKEILDFYQIPQHAKGAFLKEATTYTRDEMEKAANDFAKNMAIDLVMDHNPLATSLPGRMVDSFVLTKLMHKLEHGQQTGVKPPAAPQASSLSGGGM